METSEVICRPDQLTGFYERGTLAVRRLGQTSKILFFKDSSLRHFWPIFLSYKHQSFDFLSNKLTKLYVLETLVLNKVKSPWVQIFFDLHSSKIKWNTLILTCRKRRAPSLVTIPKFSTAKNMKRVCGNSTKICWFYFDAMFIKYNCSLISLFLINNLSAI